MQAWIDRQKPRTQRLVNLAFQPTYRALAIAGGTAMHLGIATMMSVGNFSYIMISSYFLLWERDWIVGLVAALGRFWRWIFKGSVLKVLYDGECGLCTRLARTLRGLDPFGTLELIDFRQRAALAGVPSLAALQTRTRWKRRTCTWSRRTGRCRRATASAMTLARRVPALAAIGLLGSIPGTQLIGDPVYDRVAARRTKLHVKCDENCAVPGEESLSLWPGLPRLGLGAHSRPPQGDGAQRAFRRARLSRRFLRLVLAPRRTIKLLDHPVGPDKHMPSMLFSSIQELELWQKWDMFSPNPMDTDIYLMGRGQLTDGTEVDVLRGDEHGGPLPPIYPELFFSRWTKFVNNLAYAGQPWLLEFGRYLCRHWNYNPPPGRLPLSTFKIFREQRRIPDLGKEPVPWGEEMLWEHHCFDTPAAAPATDGGTADAGTPTPPPPPSVK